MKRIVKLGAIGSAVIGFGYLLQKNDWEVSTVGVVRFGRAAVAVRTLEDRTYMYIEFIAVDKVLFFNIKVLILFLFLHKNIRCGYSLEAPHRGASNEYPQYMILWSNKKIFT